MAEPIMIGSRVRVTDCSGFSFVGTLEWADWCCYERLGWELIVRRRGDCLFLAVLPSSLVEVLP